MDKSVVAVICALLTLLAGFSAYRWQQSKRVREVKKWVAGYLLARFGAPLGDLRITCTDDRRWPVLASCDDPRTRTRHRLRFSCSGAQSAYALLAEEQEDRPSPAGAATIPPR